MLVFKGIDGRAPLSEPIDPFRGFKQEVSEKLPQG